MHFLFAIGCAATAVGWAAAQAETGNSNNWFSVANTILLIVLNLIATRNAIAVRRVERTVNESAPGAGETVQRTVYIDQNGDEHIIIHRYMGGAPE